MAKKAPVILQLSDTECGIACLAMLFAYYQYAIPFERLRDQCAVGRDGCKAQTLIDVATYHGFSASAWQIDSDTACRLTSPVIAHWKFSHYVVLNGMQGGRIAINDPATGARQITNDEFDRCFTGVIIHISPTTPIKRIKSPSRIRYIIKHWLAAHRREWVYLLLCAALTAYCPYLLLSTNSVLIDQLLVRKNASLLIPLISLSAMLNSIFICSYLLYKSSQQRLIQYSSMQRASETIKHILHLPLLYYSLRQRSEILAITTRIETVYQRLFNHTINLWISTLTAIACVIVMTKMNALIALYSITSTACYLIVTLLLSKYRTEHEKSITSYSAKLYTHTLSSVKNIETIQACGLEETTLIKWQSLYAENMQLRDTVKRLCVIQSSIGKSLTTLSLFVITLLSNDNLSQQLSCYALHLLFYAQITTLISSASSLQTIALEHERVHDVNLYTIDPRHRQPRLNKQPGSMSDITINCQNVSFHYNPHHTATLQNITFTILKNQHIAFVGKTGSGKSTLAKLLCALYQPSEGQIVLFGENLANYSAHDLARLCAYVSQDVSLFSGTLYQNLTLGNHQDQATIQTALRIACLESLITERGLHAKVEENGKNFSGGEKQRIDIARALLQNTPILILDEATSALDNETQARLVNNLRSINKTIIFIAHRLSSVAHCDRIFSLSHGKLSIHETPAQ